MLAIVCPGQGSQTPGFLSPWLELDGVRDRLEALGEAGGLDLVAHGTVSDADTIKDTAVAQPLIVAAGLVTAGALLPAPTEATGAVLAGHSVGEFTATALAGVVSGAQAMSLVATRGRAMAEASAVTPTGMAAVLGGDTDEVLATIERHGLTPANVNGAGQVVAAGTLEQIEALRADPPAKARVIPLQVAGAFHTHHMAPAVDALAAAAADLTPADPTLALLSNADGRAVTDGAEVVTRLVRQVSNPVRWDQCMATLVDLGVTGLLELAPAGTLVGLAKRAMPGVETVAPKTPDDLDAARALVETHGGTDNPSPREGNQ
ncbi:ACP S-malonyltransferase [Humibacillus xanthopallidus]|uniref:[acyl-carrier-protein] S-malonyltransferase n=1 Tax=Humibacillus xanthopallidus TaxID=412689 RepID=A0A543HWY6_9MICO|nr:ACP S-malonyltransferase [Humibacillus xanthopallidus]TQM62837.1 [acyl-carrier-protein] S-malonyltransferase [Humibacillus xanthopallidus]